MAIIELANDIYKKVPDQYNIEEVSKRYPVIYTNSMNTVLRQVDKVTSILDYSFCAQYKTHRLKK